MSGPYLPGSHCAYCMWHNMYMTCQDGSRELAYYEHLRDEHPEQVDAR